jgi:hypothetical protein
MTTVAKHSEHPMYYFAGAPFPSSATLQYADVCRGGAYKETHV